MKRSFLFVIIILMLSLYTITIQTFGAVIEIPKLFSLFTIDRNLMLSPYIYMELSLSGGLKNSASLFLAYEMIGHYSLLPDSGSELTIYLPSLHLYSLQASLANLFDFITVDLFAHTYKKAGLGGSYNTMFFDRSEYEYVYTIYGYGISLSFAAVNTFALDIIGYAAIDPNLDPMTAPTYKLDSLDIRMQLNFIEELSLLAFVGTTSFTSYRGAVSLQLKQKTFKILITTGINEFADFTTLTDLYLLFEQSINIPNFAESISIFSPQFPEGNKLFIHLDLGYKDRYEIFQTGILSTVYMESFTLSQLTFSPYIYLLNMGIQWKAKLDIAFISLLSLSSFVISFETSF